MSDKILYDLFPAYVGAASAEVAAKLPSAYDLSSSPITPDAYQISTARVIVTEKHVLIAVDSPDGAQIVFREEYNIFKKSDKQTEDSYIITNSDKVLAFKKDTNCGCGSRLRSWNPYKTLTAL